MMGGLGWFGVVLDTLDMLGLCLVYAGLCRFWLVQCPENG